MSNEENKNNRIYSKESLDQINKMFEDILENGPVGNHDVLDMVDVINAKTDPNARQRIIDLVNRVRERVMNSTQNKEFGIKEGREALVLNADLFFSEISLEFEKIGLSRLNEYPTFPVTHGRREIDPGVYNPFEEIGTLHYRKLDLSDLGETTLGKFLPDGSVSERKVDWANVMSKGLAADFDGETPPGMFSIYELKDKYSLTCRPTPRALIIVVFSSPCEYDPRCYPNCEDRLPSKTKFRKLSGRRKRLVAKMIEYGERRSEYYSQD